MGDNMRNYESNISKSYDIEELENEWKKTPAEEQKTNKMVLNSNYSITMANKIIKANQKKQSLLLFRLLRIVISQIGIQDKELLTYSVSVKDLAEYLNISASNIYTEIEKVIIEGLQAIIKVEVKPNIYKQFQWLSVCQYDNNTGTITIKLHNELKPYFIGLHEFFTKTDKSEFIALSDFYTGRIYELISCDDNLTGHTKPYLIYTIPYLRNFLDCNDKFKVINNFKEKVIEKAVKKINENTKYYIRVNYRKKGRSIYYVDFYIDNNANYKDFLKKYLPPTEEKE